MSKLTYEDRGVSPHKPDVKYALKNIDKGVFPDAFCKAIEDTFCNDAEYCVLSHADGAGTKSSLAYLQYLETGDPKVFRNIAQDSLVMNLDDLLCVGATGPFSLSNTIGRDGKVIDQEVLKEIIEGYSEFSDRMASFGIEIHECGGETADLGDLVRTVVVDSTLTTRMKKSEFINCGNVKRDQVIVGLSSFGKAVYEDSMNSGIGTNGFTAARHDLLNGKYRKFVESYSPLIADGAYSGNSFLSDPLPNSDMTVGEALLSPTRTYAPIIREILASEFESISAIFHNSGGGLTKCLNFGSNIHYIKDSLFDLPPIFEYIKSQTKLSLFELCRVFNMGHRMEVVCEEKSAANMIRIAASFGVDAKVIGRTELSGDKKNRVTIEGFGGKVVYE